MADIAFYAPLKSPDHPIPSGDRAMARGILEALRQAPEGLTTEVVSRLRLYEGLGDTEQQSLLEQQASSETQRLLHSDNARQWRIWLTYHNYYKAPDLLGSAISRALNIPYILIEPSRSPKRLTGPWRRFAEHAEHACSQANVLMYMTDRDKPSLQDALQQGQNLVQLHPFLALSADQLPSLDQKTENSHHLVAVAMHRHGAKLESYQAIAKALPLLSTPDWTFAIVGDGPAHKDVRQLFEPFGERVSFHGRLEHTNLDNIYRGSDVFVWPGVDEAFGMVYLEAQAQGLPVVAEDRPGIRDVVAHPQLLVKRDSPPEFAKAIDELLHSSERRQEIGSDAQRYVKKHHLLSSATTTLMTEINRLLGAA